MGILLSDEQETDEEDNLSSAQHTMCSTCEVLSRANRKLELKYSTPRTTPSVIYYSSSRMFLSCITFCFVFYEFVLLFKNCHPRFYVSLSLINWMKLILLSIHSGTYTIYLFTSFQPTLMFQEQTVGDLFIQI